MANGLQFIDELCKKHTNLSSEEIRMVSERSETLQTIADLAQANTFIDCPCKDGRSAVVVAEAVPTTVRSLYSEPVVGKFAYESFEPAVFFTHRSGDPATRKRAVTQEGKFVKQSVIPIQSDDGVTIGSLIMEQDISEQVDHENRLKALSKTTEQLSQTLIGLTEKDSLISDMIQESLFLLNPDGVIAFANSCAVNLTAEMTGAGEVFGSRLTNLLPFLKDFESEKKDMLVKEMAFGKKVFEVKRICLRKQERLSGTLFILRDLTELRETERELMVKSAVIKEIHHRVKNNLQTVASLLRLQMKRGIPEEAQDYFRDSLHRILSIATVHEELLADTGVDRVEMYQLLQRIGQMLVRNRSVPETDILFQVKGHPIYLKSDWATSVALVVNELIQNCLKHAFREHECGEIQVTLTETEDSLEVCVWDNGIGYSPSKSPSLGLEIVHTIVAHDLSGQFLIKAENVGTRALVTFPKGGRESS